jgi:hypothetical protein
MFTNLLKIDKKYQRILLVIGCLAFLMGISYALKYHPEWFKGHILHYFALKFTLKSAKWIVVIIAFWLGKKYLNKNKNLEHTVKKSEDLESQ